MDANVTRFSAYLNLPFITGFTADGFNDGVFAGPDFIIIYLQATIIPTTNVHIVKVVLPHLLKIHYFISVKKKAVKNQQKIPPRRSNNQKKTSLQHQKLYLPGESPFSSNRIPSPETPVKLVFIRKSSSVAPSIGRMASHRP